MAVAPTCWVPALGGCLLAVAAGVAVGAVWRTRVLRPAACSTACGATSETARRRREPSTAPTARREVARASWPPERAHRRLRVRAKEAQQEADRATEAHAEAVRQLEVAQQEVAAAASRMMAKRAVLAERQAELAAHVATPHGDDGMDADDDGHATAPASTNGQQGAVAEQLSPETLLQLLRASPQGLALLAGLGGQQAQENPPQPVVGPQAAATSTPDDRERTPRGRR